jgi:excisionase family DNA binding protein
MISEHEDRLTLTVTEAAKAVGVDRRTVRRRLDGGEFPHAYRDAGREGPETGPWLIPVEDLLDAGLNLRDPAEPEHAGEGASGDSETDELRAALADAVRRAEVAEARAAERDRVIEAQELALRTLMTGADTVDEAHVTTHAVLTAHKEPTRGRGTAERVLPMAARPGVPAGPVRPVGPRPSSEDPAESADSVPPAVVPYPEESTRSARSISPGAPRKPTPPWVPIPTPSPRRRWWQRKA